MADYQMALRDDTMVVSIVGYNGPRLPLLQALESGGAVEPEDGSAPGDLVDTLEADELEGRIEIRLTPRAGARLDRDQLAACLETALARFGSVSI